MDVLCNGDVRLLEDCMRRCFSKLKSVCHAVCCACLCQETGKGRHQCESSLATSCSTSGIMHGKLCSSCAVTALFRIRTMLWSCIMFCQHRAIYLYVQSAGGTHFTRKVLIIVPVRGACAPGEKRHALSSRGKGIEGPALGG